MVDPKQKTKPKMQQTAVKVQHSPGGIRGRWMINSLSFVMIIIAAVVILVSVGITATYYSSVREQLLSRANTTSAEFQKYWTSSYDQFYKQAERQVLEYTDKEKVELQFLNRYGRILLSTSGLTSGGIPSTEEASRALTDQKAAIFTGIDEMSGERVMSVTTPLFTASGELIGGVRVISSLSIVERQIWIVIGIALLAGIILLILVIMSNSLFVRSIVDPVLQINAAAKDIASGRYGIRLQKTYDDEIGELCDTINYMSEELARAERMKNDFISSVSHELRTPLTAIGGWSETLLTGGAEEPEEVMFGLGIIQKESNRLTRMVEELLDFARIESGRLKLETELFDVSTELYEAVYMYENLLKKSGMDLSYHEDENQNYFVRGDRHRIKQVFLNILDNAAKYGAGGKQINIAITRDEDEIMIKVRDFGAGIKEEELPFVKEKFYKGSSKQRGSGIGLAVSDEIMMMHGGTLQIESSPGSGTLVTVGLPAADAQTQLEMHAKPPVAPNETQENQGE